MSASLEYILEYADYKMDELCSAYEAENPSAVAVNAKAGDDEHFNSRYEIKAFRKLFKELAEAKKNGEPNRVKFTARKIKETFADIKRYFKSDECTSAERVRIVGGLIGILLTFATIFGFTAIAIKLVKDQKAFDKKWKEDEARMAKEREEANARMEEQRRKIEEKSAEFEKHWQELSNNVNNAMNPSLDGVEDACNKILRASVSIPWKTN